MIKKKEVIYGFGHRVYKSGDPRSDILKESSRKLAERDDGLITLHNVACYIEGEMFKRKNLKANVDFFCAPTYK